MNESKNIELSTTPATVRAQLIRNIGETLNEKSEFIIKGYDSDVAKNPADELEARANAYYFAALGTMANRAYREALVINPFSINCLCSLADILSARGDNTEAFKLYLEAHDTDNNDIYAKMKVDELSKTLPTSSNLIKEKKAFNTSLSKELSSLGIFNESKKNDLSQLERIVLSYVGDGAKQAHNEEPEDDQLCCLIS